MDQGKQLVKKNGRLVSFYFVYSCQWRSNNQTDMSRNYATCSPNLTTCPDSICDPLEELGQEIGKFICPQDCSSRIYGPFTHNKNASRGIYAGVGVCTCDNFGKCSCGAYDYTPAKGKKKDTDEMGLIKMQETKLDTKTQTTHCGSSCMLLIILCPIVLIIVIISIVVSRRSLRRKGKKHDLETEARETETLNLREVSLCSNIISTEFTFKSDGDPKWEFPRSQLVLDTVLGEGEFGRVVKGYATNISGKTGIATVAVKMLKTGANSVELLALLSEFQLLQEVSHPNVIKLLGACTQETPLIIIEYAKHGSLRNYLRLSRKLECNNIEFTNGVEPITVKDILSFAWQICKGMTYLTEIKVKLHFHFKKIPRPSCTFWWRCSQ